MTTSLVFSPSIITALTPQQSFHITTFENQLASLPLDVVQNITLSNIKMCQSVSPKSYSEYYAQLCDFFAAFKTSYEQNQQKETAQAATTAAEEEPFVPHVRTVFLRNNVQQIQDVAYEWLKNNVALFSTNSNFLYQNKSDKLYGFLKGEVQSGKSKAQVGLVLYNKLHFNKTTVIILRNLTGDLLQMKRNIETLIGSRSTNTGGFLNVLKQQKLRGYNLPIYDFGKMKSKKNIEIMTSALQSNITGVVLVLANGSQFQRLLDIIEDIECNGSEPCFNLLIDEVDEIQQVSNGKTAPKRDQIYGTLRRHAESIIGVSATSFSVLFGDQQLENVNTFQLPIPLHYKGVNEVNFQPLLRDIPVVKSDENLFENDPDQEIFYKRLSKQNPYTIETRDTQGDRVVYKHPILVLNKSSNFVKHHQSCLDIIRDNKWDLPVCWTGISYDGDGIRMSNPYFAYKEIGIMCSSSGEVVYNDPTNVGNSVGELSYHGLEIGDVLEYLRSEDEACERFTHITIFSGLLASRGINFVSNNYGVAGRWHISDMYFRASGSSDCTSLIQSMRIFGVYPDTLPLTVTTTQEIMESIKKSSALQAEMFTRIKNGLPSYIRDCSHDISEDSDISSEVSSSEEFSSSGVSDIVLNQETYYKPSVPKKRLTNRISYGVLKTTNVEAGSSSEEESKSNETWEERFVRLVSGYVNKRQKTTIIMKILQFMLFSADNQATLEELRSECGVNRITDFTSVSLSKHNRYPILEKNSNGYQLNATTLEILQHLNLDF